MRFWDSTAVVPLFVNELVTDQLLPLAAEDAGITVWWGSSVEVTAALARRERLGELSSAVCADTLIAFRRVSDTWREVGPTAAIRIRAERLLRVHPLRAADSLQLAAALSLAEGGNADTIEFVCLDERLRQAAAREGLRLLPH